MTQLKLFGKKEFDGLIPDYIFNKRFSKNDFWEMNIPTFAKETGLYEYDFLRDFCVKKNGKTSRAYSFLARSVREYFEEDSVFPDIENQELLVMHKSLDRVIKKTGVKKDYLNKWRKLNNLSCFGIKQYRLLKGYVSWLKKVDKGN